MDVDASEIRRKGDALMQAGEKAALAAGRLQDALELEAMQLNLRNHVVQLVLAELASEAGTRAGLSKVDALAAAAGGITTPATFWQLAEERDHTITVSRKDTDLVDGLFALPSFLPKVASGLSALAKGRTHDISALTRLRMTSAIAKTALAAVDDGTVPDEALPLVQSLRKFAESTDQELAKLSESRDQEIIAAYKSQVERQL
ncbi:hypothetical protein [Mycolicibacterium peregrinum]|uniref:hypothetical protein n=1 Tax=Mycolicibacterium peregrinum TaxID=43304 RepID=UPI003AABADAD